MIDNNEKGMVHLRTNEKSMQIQQNQLFGVHLHEFIQKEDALSPVELAAEFGLNLKDVRKLKKQLGRC